jgi:hypothetical protein
MKIQLAFSSEDCCFWTSSTKEVSVYALARSMYRSRVHALAIAVTARSVMLYGVTMSVSTGSGGRQSA